MRALNILTSTLIAGGALMSAQPASAGRTVIDGGISANLSGYCSPVAAASPGGCSAVTLPFSVMIGAQTFNSVYINSNGTLSFNSIATQLALQNSFSGFFANDASYTGPAPATSLGDYSAPIFSPYFADGPGFGVGNLGGPSFGYDGALASNQLLTGNSLTVNFFTCTTTISCGLPTIAAISNATYDGFGSGLTGLLIINYSGHPSELSEANFELGRANALAQLNASLNIYTITLTGLSDGFQVDYHYNQGALGDIGTSGFNLPGGLNETTGPLADRSFRFTDGQLANGAVPEPGTWLTMLLGFAAIGLMFRRRKAGAPLKAA